MVSNAPPMTFARVGRRGWRRRVALRNFDEKAVRVLHEHHVADAAIGSLQRRRLAAFAIDVRVRGFQPGHHRIHVAHREDQAGRARVLEVRMHGLAVDIFVVNQFDAQFRSWDMQDRGPRLRARGVAHVDDPWRAIEWARRIRHFQAQNVAIERHGPLDVFDDVAEAAHADHVAGRGGRLG